MSVAALLRYAAAALCAVALTAGMVVLTGLPYRAEPSEESRIRLSWRAVGERVQECRAPTEEELAALPVHMRRKEICEGRLAPFRLVVRADGSTLFDGLVQAAGARQDRPTYVYQEFRVPPGERRLEIEFELERPEGSDAPAPAALHFDARLQIAPREIVLITHDADADRLVIVEPAEG